jgi:hypothetical protein
MKKILVCAAGALAFAAPAFATTLEEVTGKGIIMTIMDMDIDVVYTPDHKFTAMDGQVTGDWKIDGDQLCTSSNFQPEETCTVYPADKKSGDSFDLETPMGPIKITIK